MTRKWSGIKPQPKNEQLYYTIRRESSKYYILALASETDPFPRIVKSFGPFDNPIEASRRITELKGEAK